MQKLAKKRLKMRLVFTLMLLKNQRIKKRKILDMFATRTSWADLEDLSFDRQ